MAAHVLISALLVLALGAQAPRDWEDLSKRALQLILDGKTPEAIGLFDRAVKDAPGFDAAHYELGDAHRMRALELVLAGTASDKERQRHLELAATHLRRAADLKGQYEQLAWGKLMMLYGEDEMNRPPELVEAAREYVRVSPSSAIGHATLARALRATGQERAAITALMDARQAVSDEGAHLLAVTIIDFVATTSESRPADFKALLDYAEPPLNRAIADDPQDRRSLLAKAALMKARADKVETDPGRRATLIDESNRLFDQFRSARPASEAAPPLEPPVEPAAARAQARYTAAAALFDKVTRTKDIAAAEATRLLLEATAALDEALKLKPDHMEALVYKSLVLRSRARFESDPGKAKALTEEADRLRARAVEMQKKR